MCIVVYIDLKNAYDKAWRQAILYKLATKGIRGKIMRWLANYLTNRKARVLTEGHESEEYPVENGVPQGAVISPLLFNILLSDVPCQQDIGLFIYADDITITCRKDTMKDAKDCMQMYLKEMFNWSVCWGVEISNAKTKMQYFTRKRVRPPLLRINRTIIEYKKEIKLLGIIMDAPKLTFKAHILYLKEDCIRRMNILKALYSSYWGASTRVMKTFYTAFIRSKLSYGIEVYGAASSRLIRMLETVQNACLRLIIGARKSSPILSLEAETGIPPLREHSGYCAAKAYVKLLNRKQKDRTAELLNIKTETTDTYVHDEINSFRRRSKEFLRTIKIDQVIRNECNAISEIPPWQNMTDYMEYCEDKEEIVNNALFQDYVSNKYGNFVRVYTDGSKDMGKESTAAGMYVENSRVAISWLMNGRHSVIGAELFGIYNGLKYIKENNPEKDSIIFTDSKSAMEIIINKCNSYISIADKIRLLIMQMNMDRQVKLHWIKAHIGIKGNEVADKVAKMGHGINNSSVYPLAKEVTSELKKKFYVYWDQLWKENMQLTGKGLFLKQIRDNIERHAPIRVKNRRMEVVLCRLRIGHVGLNQYLHRFNMAQQDVCNQCGVTETVHHYLLECNSYRLARDEMKQQLRKIKIYDISMKILLGGGKYNRFVNRKIVQITAEYIRKTGRMDGL